MPKTHKVTLHLPADQPYAIVVYPLPSAAPSPRRAKSRRAITTRGETVFATGNVVPFRKVG